MQTSPRPSSRIKASNGAKKKPAVSAREAARRQKAELERQGIFEEQILHEDRSQPTVQVRGATLRRIGLDGNHVAAAERFGRDYETAEFSGLRSKGFEPGVDGGKAHGFHLRQQDARIRLTKVKEAIGERNYTVVVAVILGFTVRAIHAAGGEQHRVLSNDIRVAFNALSAFYAGTPRKDRTLVALEGLIKAYFDEAQSNLNGQVGDRQHLETAAAKHASAKASNSRKPTNNKPAKSAPAQPKDETGTRLAQSAVDRLVSWSRLNLVQISEFSLLDEMGRHGIKAFAMQGDREISQIVWVEGPYLRAAIGAQLLKAAEKLKWRERVNARRN